MRTRITVPERNKDREYKSQTSKAKNPKKPVPYDVKQGHYYRKYICTHGWSAPVDKEPSKRQRTNHVVRGIECPAFVRLGLKLNRGTYSVQVTGASSRHNHPVGTAFKHTYAENRKVTSPSKRRDAEKMWLVGANKKLVLKYFRKTTNIPFQPKDIENMFAKFRAEKLAGVPVNVRVDRIIEEFTATPGNVVETFKDDREITSCITLQTAHMRRTAARFPEVLCVDATHGTNVNRYRLFSFMATDSFGDGAFVQHALLDGESVENMRSAIHAFKKNNPSWTEVNVFVIDKDFKELGLLKQEFPAATVILCHFHVIDYLNREISKAVYRFDSFQKVNLKNFVVLMVRATTEEEFMGYFTALEKLCGASSKFLEYFNANWMTCQELWCRFKRDHIPHLDNNTNNRLEASWGALKDIVSAVMEMDETIEALWSHQVTKETTYQLRTKQIGVRINHSYDSEMQMLAKIATKFACDLVEPQYNLSSRSSYEFDDTETLLGVYRLKSLLTGASYAVDPHNVVCSCSVYTTLLLPCRHILHLRRVLPMRGPIIPLDKIRNRWLIADIQEYEENVVEPPGRHKVHGGRPTHAMTSNQKYNKVHAICQRLSALVAEKGTRSFDKWCARLVDLERVVRRDGAPDEEVKSDSGGEDEEVKSDSGGEDGSGDEGDDCDAQGDIGDSTGDIGSPSGEIGDGVGEPAQPAPPISATKLNEATRPAGRHRTTKAAAKKKKNRLINESKKLAERLQTESDFTLKDLQVCIAENRLSLEGCGAVVDALPLVFGNPERKDIETAKKSSTELSAKRPRCVEIEKAGVMIEPGHIRYIFPVDLVDRCLSQVQYFRKKLHVLQDDVAVELRDVGTYRTSTLFTMRQFDRLKILFSQARDLLEWVDSIRLHVDDTEKEEAKQNMLVCIPLLNVTEAMQTGYNSLDFASFASFGNSKWLSDSAIYAASRYVAEISPLHVRVVDPLFLQFTGLQSEVRDAMLRGRDCFADDVANRGLVCCPIFITEPSKHWCLVIIDFSSDRIVVYDPLQNPDNVTSVLATVSTTIQPSLPRSLPVVHFLGLQQTDGNSCGVLVVLFLETYISITHQNALESVEDLVNGNVGIPTDEQIQAYRFELLCRVWIKISEARADTELDE